MKSGYADYLFEYVMIRLRQKKAISMSLATNSSVDRRRYTMTTSYNPSTVTIYEQHNQ
jgi:hypothetical protein